MGLSVLFLKGKTYCYLQVQQASVCVWNILWIICCNTMINLLSLNFDFQFHLVLFNTTSQLYSKKPWTQVLRRFQSFAARRCIFMARNSGGRSDWEQGLTSFVGQLCGNKIKHHKKVKYPRKIVQSFQICGIKNPTYCARYSKLFLILCISYPLTRSKGLLLFG